MFTRVRKDSNFTSIRGTQRAILPKFNSNTNRQAGSLSYNDKNNTFYGNTGKGWIPFGNKNNQRTFREFIQTDEDLITNQRICTVYFDSEEGGSVDNAIVHWTVYYGHEAFDHELQNYRDDTSPAPTQGFIEGFPIEELSSDVPNIGISPWSTTLLTHNNFGPNPITQNTDKGQVYVFRGNESLTEQINIMFNSNDVTIENITSDESGAWDFDKSATSPGNSFLVAFGARPSSSTTIENINYSIQSGCFKLGDTVQLPSRVQAKTNWDILQNSTNANTWTNEPLTPTRWEIPIPSTVIANKPDEGNVLLGINGPAISIDRNSGETLNHIGLVGTSGTYYSDPLPDIYAPSGTDGLSGPFSNRRIAYFKVRIKYGSNINFNQYPGQEVTYWWLFNPKSILVINGITADAVDFTTGNVGNMSNEAILRMRSPVTSLTTTVIQNELRSVFGTNSIIPPIDPANIFSVWYNPEDTGKEFYPGRLAWYIATPDIIDGTAIQREDWATAKVHITIRIKSTTTSSNFNDTYRFSNDFSLTGGNTNLRNYGFCYCNLGGRSALINNPSTQDTGEQLFREQNWAGIIAGTPAAAKRFNMTCIAPRLGFADVSTGYTSGVIALRQEFDIKFLQYSNWSQGMFTVMFNELLDVNMRQAAMQQDIFNLNQVTRNLTMRIDKLTEFVIELATVVQSIIDSMQSEDSGPFGLGAAFTGDFGLDLGLNILTISGVLMAGVFTAGLSSQLNLATVQSIGKASYGQINTMNQALDLALKGTDRVLNGDERGYLTLLSSLMTAGMAVNSIRMAGGVSASPGSSVEWVDSQLLRPDRLEQARDYIDSLYENPANPFPATEWIPDFPQTS